VVKVFLDANVWFSAAHSQEGGSFFIMRLAKAKLLAKYAKIISKKDAPILACAAEHSDYLLTLDNEFLKAIIINSAARSGLKIIKPKDFIEIYR